MRAAREGPTIYLLTAAALAIGAGVVVWQRHRPLHVCIALGLPAVVVAALLVRLRGSLLGLAYHGELLLHHFLAVLCAAACVAVAIGWAADPKLGRSRLLPAVPAFAGAALLLAEHLSRAPDATIGLLGQVGTASLLLSAPLALAALWSQLQPLALRWGAVALLIPLAVRCALGESLSFRACPSGQRPPRRSSSASAWPPCSASR
ncbi:hypothetical protein [Nannocystis pusilla]|uniref:hypothetical protein n=1 Tax=Nannocystis pusilla TaxID=889268 RepID=UPI003B7B8D16